MNGQSKLKAVPISGAHPCGSLYFLFCAMGIGLATLLGCGRSESPGSAVVPPPGPVAGESGDPPDAEPPNSEPPGGIELPPGSIPTPAVDERA